jgi:bacillithiol system protein YtxJ
MDKWHKLNTLEQLESIKNDTNFSVIFKHSTRCSISTMAKNRLEKGTSSLEVKATLYYLDLISYRPISNAVSELFSVMHESPQILVTKSGDCLLDASHLEINVSEILEVISQ